MFEKDHFSICAQNVSIFILIFSRPLFQVGVGTNSTFCEVTSRYLYDFMSFNMRVFKMIPQIRH